MDLAERAEMFARDFLEGQAELIRQELKRRTQESIDAGIAAGRIMEQERCLKVLELVRSKWKRYCSPDAVDALDEAEDFIADPTMVWRDEEPLTRKEG